MNEDQVRSQVRDAIKQYVNGGAPVAESEENEIDEDSKKES